MKYEVGQRVKVSNDRYVLEDDQRRGVITEIIEGKNEQLYRVQLDNYGVDFEDIDTTLTFRDDDVMKEAAE